MSEDKIETLHTRIQWWLGRPSREQLSVETRDAVASRLSAISTNIHRLTQDDAFLQFLVRKVSDVDAGCSCHDPECPLSNGRLPFPAREPPEDLGREIDLYETNHNGDCAALLEAREQYLDLYEKTYTELLRLKIAAATDTHPDELDEYDDERIESAHETATTEASVW